MNEIADRYRRLAGAFADRIAAVPADRWGAPTPCPDWTVRDLVQHVVETQGRFLGLVGRAPDPAPAVPDDPAGAAGAAGAWDSARTAVQTALDDPTQAGTAFDSKLFGRTTLAEAVDRFVNFDLVVHGWDLARATGQDERIDPEDLTRVSATATALGEQMRQPGGFGPPVPAPAGADEQARLLAFLGRAA